MKKTKVENEDAFVKELAKRFASPLEGRQTSNRLTKKQGGRRGRGGRAASGVPAVAPAWRRVIKSIGDDTSVTLPSPGSVLLTTTDTLVESTHFERPYTPARLLGRKALSVSLSDIAAMGGAPLFFLVSITFPAGIDKKYIDGIYDGFKSCSDEFGVPLIGGNTARAPIVTISTTVLGEVKRGREVLRSGARPGEIIFVTGTPGDSALGLKVLRNHGLKALKGRFKRAALRHLDPAPRLSAGQELSRLKLATSMIDVSDGVALDLKRLTQASGAGAEICLSGFPISKELKLFSETTGSPWVPLALSGGEDYELLFTARPKDEKKIAALSRSLGLKMTRIGRVTETGLNVIGADGRPVELKRLGFEHF